VPSSNRSLTRLLLRWCLLLASIPLLGSISVRTSQCRSGMEKDTMELFFEEAA
jgi:hypothetical protein